MTQAGTPPAEADAEDLPGRRLGAVALHPLLLAIHPAMSLWAVNADEVFANEVWPALWVPALGTLTLWAVGAILLRNARQAAVGASVAAVGALYGTRLPGSPSLATAAVLALAAGVGATLLARRWTRPTMLGITATVNVLSVVLVALTLPSIVSTSWSRRTGSSAVAADVALATDRDPADLPDIFYIIPDRYPRADTLEEVFDYDNSAFLGHLEELGFQVAERSLANYPSTGMSLTATWNLNPVSTLIPEPPENPKDWAPAYRLLRDHALGRTLVDAGYEYIHMGTWWSPTSVAASATQNLRLDGDSEFVSVFRNQIEPAGQLRDAEPEDRLEDMVWYERSPLYTRFQLQELRRLAEESRQPRDRPRFVLAHITVPHEPYVFEADGSPVPPAVAQDRTREDNFLRQLEFVNNQIDDLLDIMLTGPRSQWPVVVIQSDEGPHPVARTGPDYDWTTAPVEVQREKLRTLSAILLPESDLVLPEDLTGVNTWRLLLDEILGTHLGPIDAPVYVYDPAAIYDVIDVTDRIRGTEPVVDD